MGGCDGRGWPNWIDYAVEGCDDGGSTLPDLITHDTYNLKAKNDAGASQLMFNINIYFVIGNKIVGITKYGTETT